MGKNIQVDPSKLDSAASKLAELSSSYDTIAKQLMSDATTMGDAWQGDAAQATMSAYDSFAAKYFQNYHDIIDAYVKFLRQNVAADYVTTETSNTNLAEAFK